MIFDFDMGRKEYIEKMNKYGMIDETAIKSDKIYFERYYGIDLDKYVHSGRKFIIPYEMADLFCLMMAVMKSSPTYDQRKKNISSQNIIEHNKEILKLVENLPTQVANSIKFTAEYDNANAFVQCLSIIVERMAALMHIALEKGNADRLEKLIDGLDEVFECFFWDVKPEDSFTNEPEMVVDNVDGLFEHLFRDAKPFSKFAMKLLKPYLEPFLETTPITVSIINPKSYHLFDKMLADRFNALDRSNWPDGIEPTITELVRKWKDKYKDERASDAKIKDEYLRWLSGNEWHILNNVPALIEDSDTDNKKIIEGYNDRYNKKALILPEYYGEKTGSNKKAEKKAEERMEHELSQIKLLLQNRIDAFILSELSEELMSNGLDEFNKLLHQPKSKHLSRAIFLLIVELSSDNSSERAHSLLTSYLSSTSELLNKFDNMYLGDNWVEYVVAIINDEKDVDGCCAELYENVFVKIQSQKCDYFFENKNVYRTLREGIMLSAGNMLTEIIEKDNEKREGSRSITYSPKKEGSS